MIRYEMHPETPNKRFIAKALEVLNDGGLIIYPTDTVYGIGCDLYNKKALESIYRLKGKSKFDPVSLVLKDIQQASRYARISNFAYRTLRHCLPGPYTFILPATREIPKIMLSRRKEVGIRIPENNVCQILLEDFENPLVNTSVNLEDDIILNDPDEIEQRYNNSIDIMLDAGFLPDARESTIVNMINDEPEILRNGKGDPDKLFE